MTDDTTRLNVWTSIFKRKGGNGRFTKLFEEFDDALKSQLLGSVRMREDELPILAFIEDVHRWLLLTTQRVCWRADGEVQKLPTLAIVDVKPIDFGTVQKAEMNKLMVKTADGGQFVLEVEQGAPFLGIWNVLVNAMERNRRKQKQTGP